MSALFEPLRVKSLELANRIVIAPMCQYSALDGRAQAWHMMHLGQLAVGGAGMLILEATGVAPEGRITPRCLGLYDDACESALAPIVDEIRARSPIALSIQLGHAGRKSSSHVPWEGGQLIAEADGGWHPLAPSPIAQLDREPPPRAMTDEDLDRTKAAFVDSTRRAARLGFDSVEIHAAHGYLLHQFLSPLSNQRTDRYGGSLENRMRYPLEVVEAMRAVWPQERPLAIRISATDWVEESSWTPDEAAVFARLCVQAGVDMIHVTSGGVSPKQRIAIGPGYQVAFAATIREQVDVPVIAVGLITEPRQAEEIVSSGQADLVALARAMLYDPRWAWHAAAELGATVHAPPQYWRANPGAQKGLFGDTPIGMR